jgi:sugar lactone lactonase YvrE
MAGTPHCVIKDVRFPEGMRWHEGGLWFSDIAGNRVYRYDPAIDELAVVAELPSPSGLGFGPGRAYVVSLGYDLLYGIDLATGDAAVVLDLAAASGTFNFNDMISDGEGGLYAGSVGHRRDMTGGFAELDHSDRPPGRLWRIDTRRLVEARVRRVRVDGDPDMVLAADGVGGPNGMVLRPDGRTLVVAETAAGRLTEFVRSPDGRLGNRRSITTDRTSDGLAGDARGGLWTNGMHSSDDHGRGPCRYERLDANGRPAEAVELPVPAGWGAVACVLGGADRRTLFMTASRADFVQWLTARENWDQKDAEAQIWACQVDVPGAGIP